MADVFARVLSLSLSGALVALFILALRSLFGRKLSQTWRYYVWLIVLMRLALPFAPQEANLMDFLARRSAALPPQMRTMPSPVATTVPRAYAPAPQSEKEIPGLMAMEKPSSPADVPDVRTKTDPSPQTRPVSTVLADLWQYAWVVWLGVALMLLVHIVTRYCGFARFIRAGWQPVDDPDVLDVLDEVSGLYGLRKPLPLYLNPLATSPMLIGILRPSIVLPTCHLEKERLRLIFAHELIHYKRKDILFKWCVQVISCLHWFNPLVYWVKRDVNIACELSCDEQVLARLDQERHRQYGDTLLAVIQISGNYGDTVASVTMSEEGKIMKTRLQSIANPHRRTKWTVLCSLTLSLLLIFAATHAGAYTGIPVAADEGGDGPLAILPVADATPVPAAEKDPSSAPNPPVTPAPEATRQPTPGERLDNLLSDVNALGASLGGHVSDWAQDWADNWDWDTLLDDTDDWGWNDPRNWDADSDSDDNMFSSYRSNGRTVIHEGYYADGYILHLKYDSTAKLGDQGVAVLHDPAVLLPEPWAAQAQNAQFLDILQGAADSFVAHHAGTHVQNNGFLRLVNVKGPYTQSPDELLDLFYRDNKLGYFVAVLNSGLTSVELRAELLRDTLEDENVAYLVFLLDADTPVDTADALLQTAYDNRDIASFYILLDYASAQARKSILNQATRDAELEFLAGIDETPSAESIDALMDHMEDLDTGLIAMLADQLTPEQAQKIAAAAYEQDDVGAFTLVMDRLSEEEIKAYNERAHQDHKTSFYILTGFYPMSTVTQATEP